MSNKQKYFYLIVLATILLLTTGTIAAAEYWQPFNFEPGQSFTYEVSQADDEQDITFTFSFSFADKDGQLQTKWQGSIPMGEMNIPFSSEYSAPPEENYAMKLFQEGLARDFGGMLIFSFLRPALYLLESTADPETASQLSDMRVLLEMGKEYSVVIPFQVGTPEAPEDVDLRLTTTLLATKTFSLLSSGSMESVQAYSFKIVIDTTSLAEIDDYIVEVCVAPGIPMPLYVAQEIVQSRATDEKIVASIRLTEMDGL